MTHIKRLTLGVAVLIAMVQQAPADPIDLIVDPSPQAAGNTCQSYSLGLAMAFNPASPLKPTTAVELRDLERRIRAEIEKSAAGAPVTHGDWKTAVEVVSDGALTVASREFSSLDAALRFAADKTGIAQADELPLQLSAALVKTPVLMSFRRIGASAYAEGHIVTIFGVALPPVSITDNARPKLLLVNSAVKYKNGLKNICADEDLSDADHYRAMVGLTGDYDLKLFAPKPYSVIYISAP